MEDKTHKDLKFKKRNWLKLRANVYGFGKTSPCGSFKDVTFYKGKKLLSLSCPIGVAKMIQGYNLNTTFTIWFTVSSKFYEKTGKYYTNAYLHHAELFVPAQKQYEQDQNYKSGLNKIPFKDE